MYKSWSKSVIVLIGALLSPVLAALATTVIDGIIGNRADDIFGWLLGRLTLVTGLWTVIALLTFLCGYLFVAWFRDHRRLHQEREEVGRRSKHLITLDKLLFIMLTNLVSTDEPEAGLHRLVNKLLRGAREAFPEVRKAVLFLNDQDGSKEYLELWHSAGWDVEDADPSRKFYIGNQDPHRRLGSAGEAFVHREILVTKFEEKEGKLIPSRDSYIFFSNDHSMLPYRALVCVPVIAVTDEKKPDCLGVVCFDSENPNSFDAPETQNMLFHLGNRIAVAIKIYQRLLKICPVPQQKL